MVEVGRERALVLGIPEETVWEKADEIAQELAFGVIGLEELEVRLQGLQRFYDNILARSAVEKIIHSVRERIVPTQGKTPLQEVALWMRRLGLDAHKKEVTKKIERVIHRLQPVRKNKLLCIGSKLDDGNGDRKPGFVLGDRTPIPWEPDLEQITNGNAFSSSTPADVGLTGGGDRIQGRMANGSSANVARVPMASNHVEALQLSPPGGLRPVTPAGRSGAPASSRPGRFQEKYGVCVWAEARGPKQVLATVRGGARWSESIEVPESSLTAEAVLAAFEVTIRRLVVDGFHDIVLSTDEPTISGYIDRDWRVGSFRLLARLRAIQGVGASVVLIPGRDPRHAAR